jgi:hypothetical protein
MLKVWWKESANDIPNLFPDTPIPKSKSIHGDTTKNPPEKLINTMF